MTQQTTSTGRGALKTTTTTGGGGGGRRRAAGGNKSRTIPDAVNNLTAARKMSEVIVALEDLRRQSRDAHDAAEVAGEALRAKVREAGRWPHGWDRIPESRRLRKLAMEAAADYADAADAWDAAITRAQRIMEELNSKGKGRVKFDAAG
jgi:hypothetical protein